MDIWNRDNRCLEFEGVLKSYTFHANHIDHVTENIARMIENVANNMVQNYQTSVNNSVTGA